jgi:ribosomal protein S6--L-glutamate ligase
MRFILLTQTSGLHSSQRLLEAARERGHDIEAIDFTRCSLTMEPDHPEVHLAERTLESVDGVLARIGGSSPFFGVAVVRQFEMQDVCCINGSLAIARCRDKLRTLQILTRRGVGMPRTAVADHPDEIDRLLRSVGNPPYIIKVVEGSKGLGVVKADTLPAARSVVEVLQELQAKILVQEFIAEAEGSDLRCFVIGDKVVAAMRRQGAPDDFRANLHRGGTASKAKLSKLERETALAASRAMGLAVAGVDLIRSNRGPLVLEVNASPGLRGIEETTGIDVATKIVEHLERLAPKGHRGDRPSSH